MRVPNLEDSSPRGLLVSQLPVGAGSPNGKLYFVSEDQEILINWRMPSAPSPNKSFRDTQPDASPEPFLVHLQRSQIIESFNKERDKFFEIKDNLLDHETYRGKFVAIHDGRVVGVDEDKRELAKRVYLNCGYVPIYIGKVEREQTVGEMSSPERA